LASCSDHRLAKAVVRVTILLFSQARAEIQETSRRQGFTSPADALLLVLQLYRCRVVKELATRFSPVAPASFR
jgi:hypothetical protein